MLSRGAGDTQKSIRESINKYTKNNGTVDFVLHLKMKSGEETSQTTRYQWNGSEAVPV